MTSADAVASTNASSKVTAGEWAVLEDEAVTRPLPWSWTCFTSDPPHPLDPKLKRRITKGLPLKPGLYLYCTPSSDNVGVLRVAWIRRSNEGDPDEYEAVNSVTPMRGEYTTMLVDAEDKPPANWKWTKPLARPSPLHRAQIRHPVSLNPVGYAKVCPKPDGWKD